MPLLNRALIIALPLILLLITVIACSRPPVPARTLPSPIPAIVPGGAGVVYSDPAQAVEIKVGEEFSIRLKSNPSTGFSWQEMHDPSLIQLADQQFTSDVPSDSPPLPGAGGTDIYRFKALKAGETTISLVYQRHWETPSPLPPENQKIFTVRIK